MSKVCRAIGLSVLLGASAFAMEPEVYFRMQNERIEAVRVANEERAQRIAAANAAAARAAAVRNASRQLRSSDPTVRTRAIRTLKRLRAFSTTVVVPVIAQLQYEHPEVSAAAADYLLVSGRAAQPEVRLELLEAVCNGDPLVQERILESNLLQAEGSTEDYEALLCASRSSDVTVAAKAISKIEAWSSSATIRTATSSGAEYLMFRRPWN